MATQVRGQSTSGYDNVDPRVHLVLTATIDPGTMQFVARRQPEVRLSDYVSALRKWIRHVSLFQSILWIENSAHPLVRVIQEEFSHVARVVSFSGNDYSSGRGKGYGEAVILEKATSFLAWVGDDYVIKCTGRLYYRNIASLVAVLVKHPDMVVRLSRDLSVADSRVFAIRASLLQALLEGFKDEVDDSRGRYFEHVLARRVLAFASRGHKVLPFPSMPLLEGWSGTSGRRVGSRIPDARSMLRYAAYGISSRLTYI